MDIEWEDPPETAVGGGITGRYALLARALRENPGRWARFPGENRSEKGVRNTAGSIRQGRVKGFEPKGAFEVKVQGTALWVRFIGDQDATRTPVADDQVDDDRVDRKLAPMVREWAAVNGYDIGSRGRLPQNVIDAYFDAQNYPKAPDD